jgi:hypothetical protein
MEHMVQPMILEDDGPDEIETNEAPNLSPNKRSKSGNDPSAHSRLLESHIKIALSLYKVQQNIYLLDFQRIEVIL